MIQYSCAELTKRKFETNLNLYWQHIYTNNILLYNPEQLGSAFTSIAGSSNLARYSISINFVTFYLVNILIHHSHPCTQKANRMPTVDAVHIQLYCHTQ